MTFSKQLHNSSGLCIFLLSILVTPKIHLFGQTDNPTPQSAFLHARLPCPETSIQRIDLTPNQITLLKRKFPALSAHKFVVSIKERNFQVQDPDIRNRSFLTAFSASSVDLHATEMATLIAGAGNSGYTGIGVAEKVTITSASFDNLMPEPLVYYKNHNITVQNHSYGTGIENRYAEDAAAYDLLTWQNPGLLHVFSAGNRGESTPDNGKYAGINGYSNLTGSFKMSKNSLSVGATDSFFRLEKLSSSGPAYDGRLKPEIVAFGIDGSSGSAALVSGTALLLQEAYFNQQGEIPPAALVKSVLITSAQRPANQLPNFKTGYGNLNAFAALQIMAKQHFKTGDITSESSQGFSVFIPQNSSKFTVTLCWSDTAATPGVGKALTNDLDLWLTTPNGQTIQPWVLSAFPHKDSLALPSIQKRDTLNTTEQISLSEPVSGTYTLFIKANKLSTNRQPWALSWQITQSDTFYFTHPVSIFPIESGKTGIIRWQNSYPATTTGKIEYRYIEQHNWVTLASAIDLGRLYYQGTMPTNTGLVQFRMTIDNNSYLSDSVFVSQPPSFTVGYICSDTVLLQWKKQTGINQYRIYGLGEKIMDTLGLTTDTIFKIPARLLKNDWATVSAISPQQSSYEFRAPSKAISFQSVGCYFINFLSQWDNGRGILNFSLSTRYNLTSISVQKQKNNQFENLKTIPNTTERNFTFTDSFLQKGANIYRVVLQLNDGRQIVSDLQTLIQPDERGWWVFPNPVKRGSRLNVVNRWNGSEELMVDIFDTNGRKTSMKLAALIDNSFTVSNLLPGVYFLVFYNGNKQLGTNKLVIIP